MAADWEALIVTADLETCRTLASLLSQWGFESICASTAGKAIAMLAETGVPLVFCEDRLADGGFRDVLGAVKLLESRVRTVVVSRTEDGAGHAEAIQLGAFDVLLCPCRPTDVHRVIGRATREDGETSSDLGLLETHELKAFYDNAKASVFRFSYLFLGRKDLASECTFEAFLDYLREKPVLQATALPPRLMGCALVAVKRRSQLVSPVNRAGQGLPEKVLCIPCDQRAVFIMRSVLGMSDLSVALATGLPLERVRSLWHRSLFNLRDILPREFFERVVSGSEEDTVEFPDEFLLGGESHTTDAADLSTACLGFGSEESLAVPEAT